MSLTTDDRESEVEAYQFIRTQLAEVGWDVRNPERHASGQVWTQNQCLSHPEIRRCLGAMRPENVVKLSETSIWIIEAKSRRRGLAQALSEAENEYAWKVQNAGSLSVPLITGVAGNEASGYEVRTRLLVNGSYRPVTINGAEATGLLGPQTIRRLIDTGNPDIADLPIDEAMFLRAAEQINRTLHGGGINKNDRARVMAALLLALLQSNGPDLEADLPVLIADINARSEQVLRLHGKREFCPFVHIEPPTNSDNHVKYKAAIVRTVQTLMNLSIKSAMNSGADVLGKFYEVFLKYGNGAKEIGIVLTPRHLTRFAVDTVGVGPTDVVCDVACGTGGFLVAAFDHVRRLASATQIDRFKRYNLFGIEQESAVAALAIVNMIFRGDGKNNIVEANCFSRFLKRAATPDGHPTARYVSTPPAPGDEGVTRVFMNPPFALKETDAKEWRFVDVALQSMVDGGKLFAIVPLSVMSEDSPWRRDSLLARHTLLAVISLPEEMFYPVANQTVAVIIEKGRPHRRDRPVLWGRVERDGFMKSKARRLPTPPEVPNDLQRLAPILRSFLAGGGAAIHDEPEFIRVAPIDYSDPLLELVPAAYLTSAVPDAAALSARLDRQVRDDIAAQVDLDLRHGSADRPGILDSARTVQRAAPIPQLRFGEIQVDTIFDLMAGDYHSLAEVSEGDTLVVSCADYGNGVIGTYTVPSEALFRDCLTIAFNGSPLTTKLHPYDFGAKDDVAVAVPRTELPPEALVFIQATLNSERWRFSYYRKCFRAKLARLRLELPVTADGSLDVDGMVRAVRAQPYWSVLAPRLSPWRPNAPERAARGRGRRSEQSAA